MAKYNLPTTEMLRKELDRENYRIRYNRILKNTIYSLVTVAAIAVLVATLLLPVFRIYGQSMTPTLHDGDIVVSVKTSNLQTGDIISFYYNNKILVKRVIAGPGDFVEIEMDGTVKVNGNEIEEPYISEKSMGECDIIFPYQVPDSHYFVMGDHREVSVDSRSSTIGCIAEEQIVGKLVFAVWPMEDFGELK
ncbi:MAG: signal peptidase I [Firmicutes bacterium]|nr:signal peptidase I [Bacillota bacterium]